MKSYIINIELIGSDPIIWRKVILPAGATFNRLNDIIQNVTNFQSGYPNLPYHLFEFDLGNLIVTNYIVFSNSLKRMVPGKYIDELYSSYYL